MTLGRVEDLIVLVADANMEYAVRGLLTRHASLGIRSPSHQIYVHPERDPGCYLRAAEFLQPFSRQYHQALVLFDHDGCGQESKTAATLEAEVNARLDVTWNRRASAIVIDPELEAWVWSDSPHVGTILGWAGRDLRAELVAKGLLAQGAQKPGDPKGAVEFALSEVKKQRSSALYKRLAERVSFSRCTDPAFDLFKRTLAGWFPL
ncbi:MAG: hypothetical protein IT381_29165 [Deltaproteobacteria bacterium]|nr:hypothetical protein [Deltaproteobacteria bacterium]